MTSTGAREAANVTGTGVGVDIARVDVTEAGVTEAEEATHATASTTVSVARAFQELGLQRGEFDLAVHLGLVATEHATGGAAPRVRRQEIDRLRALPGFPESLRVRVRTAGTAEGAALLGVSPARFTGLARIGCITPVAFYLNRYRAVVWLYRVEELRAFAAGEPDLVGGKGPAGMRALLDAGTDRRARNWRSRRVERLLSRTEDPWARAALHASGLDAVQLAEVVDDPYERAHLTRTRPDLVYGRPGSLAGKEAMAKLMLADDPDEILWRRVNLTLELDRAREARPAPRPGYASVPGHTRASAPPTVAAPNRTSGRALRRPGTRRQDPGRGLLARIGLRRPTGRDHSSNCIVRPVPPSLPPC
ncbi:DUF6397 family protein [Streptomyces argenteolus]|uniref:DUF6397 family protein n=1 Tax=Streptomyces argenteolus TaxID=67274 RepID=A0ABW6X452_9ACTN